MFDDLLRGQGQAQQGGLVPGFADGLHADGQSPGCVARGEGDGRQPRQIGGGGEAHDLDGGGQVRVAVGQGVGGDGGCGDARGGGQDYIHLLEGGLEVVDHARADALGGDVVGGGEFARQRQIEAHVQSVLVMVLRVGGVHGLGHLAGDGDGVRDAVGFQVRDGDLADLAAQGFELPEQGFAGADHFRFGVAEPGPVHADLQAFEGRVPAGQRGRRLQQGGRVLRVGTSDQGVGQCCVGGGARQGADVGDAPIQRGRAEFTDAPVGGLQSHHAAKRGGDADRAAAVRADGHGA